MSLGYITCQDCKRYKLFSKGGMSRWSNKDFYEFAMFCYYHAGHLLKYYNTDLQGEIPNDFKKEKQGAKE